MSQRVDETWHRLQVWTSGQAPSERLAAQILLSEGYRNLDPSHPLGGPDGRKDAVCNKDGKTWVMAVYFPRGQQSPGTIRAKLVSDAAGVASNKAHGLVFVTNQELSLAERDALARGVGVPVVLYHLERITTILDSPSMRPVRAQFLLIDDPSPAVPRPMSALDEAFGPDFEPNIFVSQLDPERPGETRQAHEWFRARIYSDAFQRRGFEPDEEDRFLEAVRLYFPEDASAGLGPASDDHVLVENRGAELSFHRCWGWWTLHHTGALAMADLHRADVYSVADVVVDLVRFFALAGDLATTHRIDGSARIVVALDPGSLTPDFQPSDRIARERLGARLRGLRSIAQPVLQRTRETPAEFEPLPLQSVTARATELATTSVVKLLRKLHGARISESEFEASIPSLIEALSRAKKS